jgi:membrane protein required for beta-lactamase induction
MANLNRKLHRHILATNLAAFLAPFFSVILGGLLPRIDWKDCAD